MNNFYEIYVQDSANGFRNGLHSKGYYEDDETATNELMTTLNDLKPLTTGQIYYDIYKTTNKGTTEEKTEKLPAQTEFVWGTKR